MPEDEILTEIKKCQQELATVNEYNMEELNKLKTEVRNDLHSNELKEQLEQVDKQVCVHILECIQIWNNTNTWNYRKI